MSDRFHPAPDNRTDLRPLAPQNAPSTYGYKPMTELLAVPDLVALLADSSVLPSPAQAQPGSNSTASGEDRVVITPVHRFCLERRWAKQLISAFRRHELTLRDSHGLPIPYSDEGFAFAYIQQIEAQQWLDSWKIGVELRIPARSSSPSISNERAIALARLDVLNLSDWCDLAGAGLGNHGFYDVVAPSEDMGARVKFRKWAADFISGWPPDQQAEMLRHNEAPPLLFPCTPVDLVAFVDALKYDHPFDLPVAFRAEVAVIASQRECSQSVGKPESVEAVEQSTTSCAALKDEGPRSWPEINKSQNSKADAHRRAGDKARLVPKDRILEAFPPPDGMSSQNWARTLGDVPKWLRDARETSGKRGVSALWDPAMFALCMVSKRYLGKNQAATLLRRHFPESLDSWEEKASYLD